jgi:hypothetical protein
MASVYHWLSCRSKNSKTSTMSTPGNRVKLLAGSGNPDVTLLRSLADGHATPCQCCLTLALGVLQQSLSGQCEVENLFVSLPLNHFA